MLTTKDIRINGYPPLDVILAHFDALPILIQGADPQALYKWDVARNVERGAVSIRPVSKRAEDLLNPEPVGA